jgi:hypothetical protein
VDTLRAAAEALAIYLSLPDPLLRAALRSEPETDSRPRRRAHRFGRRRLLRVGAPGRRPDSDDA